MPSETNVVDFPENMMLQWQPYERGLREWLGSNQAHSPEMIAEQLDKIRPIFLAQARAANEFAQALPAETDAMVRTQQWVMALTSGLMKDLLFRQPADERFDYYQNWVATITLGLLKEIARRQMD